VNGVPSRQGEDLLGLGLPQVREDKKASRAKRFVLVGRVTRELHGQSVHDDPFALGGGLPFESTRINPRRREPSMASNTTFQKRQKERARLDKQREKDAQRKERRAEPATRVVGEPGVDPDIAGIVPGPQPVLEDD
jgi:hypothetical protein